MIQEVIQEGFFEKYFITPFFRRIKDFSGKESKGAAGYTVLAWLIATTGITGLLLGLVGLLGPEVGFLCLEIFGALWLCGSAFGFAAMVSRISKTGDGEGTDGRTPKPVWLLIDKLLAGVSVMFLILGILMTVTTLNSGDINVNWRGSGEPTSKSKFEENKIEEVPIFTYQDETPSSDMTEDELTELVDEDTVSLEESFDPTLPSSSTAEPDTLSLEY